jgi:diguanylate cyclase (GGDEF)-like protein
VISLKLKLVVYFLVLSLLPLAAGYWGFASTLAGHEHSRVDERLSAELRAASAAYRERLVAARGSALKLAADRSLHDALLGRDRAAIERMLRTRPALGVTTRGKDLGATEGALAARISVGDGTQVLGEVVARVPVDTALATSLTARAALASTDRLVVLLDGHAVTGAEAGTTVGDVRSGASTVELDGVSHRAAAIRAGSATIAVVTPSMNLDGGAAAARNKLLIGVAGSLLLIALVAYVEGAAIVRTIRRFVGAAQAISEGRLDERVPVRSRDEFGQLGTAFNEMADQLEAQRRRLHLATLRFGEALAATHDIDQLLRVVVTTAVESTRATGGVIRGESGDVARAGSPRAGVAAISVPLEIAGESFGTLVLSGHAFEEDDHELVASLAAHAVTALENARLHQIVKRQALLDALTGMPNRRQCESALATELSQAQRFGSRLTFVLADIDEFKAVNDRHGHPAGDRVLREFSEILRELVRDADVAARWGGDEFALILPNTDVEGAAVLVERIRSTLEHRTIAVDGQSVTITASFGVATFPDELSAAPLIAAADQALYAAKRAGKNRVETARSFPLTA